MSAHVVAGAFLSVGSALSALTKNQVIAFVLGVAVCFVFAVTSYPVVTDFLSRNTPCCGNRATYRGDRSLPGLHPRRGGLRDLIFFATFIGLAVLNAACVEQRKAD